MKKSILFLVCIAFLVAMTSLASSDAACSTCTQEGDWSQSASSFLEGKPISDVPQESGPKAVRKTASQFENKLNAAQEEPSSDDANAAATASLDASAANVTINLTSINASPSSVNSGSPVEITAIFSVSSQMQPENQTEIAGNASTSLNDEILLTASAAIKDSTGEDVGNVNLVKSAGNEYSGSWSAQVLPGIYDVNIFASSPHGSGTFYNTLQISVVASGDASNSTPAVKNLG